MPLISDSEIQPEPRYIIDTCHYCGLKYHPMPVWTRKRGVPYDDKPARIQVCNIRIDGQMNVSAWDGCQEKARAEGYEFRRDLTRGR